VSSVSPLPRRIRVLIVDDAVVVRRMLTEALGGDPEIEVVGVAANGRIALQRIAQNVPDVVTLDVEMPEMDGLETLRHLRKDHPRLPVIMFSTLTERGAEATLDALSLGASDYVTKPANVGSVTASIQRIKEQLLPRVKALGAKQAGLVMPAAAAAVPAFVRPTPAPVPAAAPPLRLPVTRPRGVDVLAIGCSTGGPNALAHVIGALRPDWSVPIVVTQHMPPMFTRLLAERLNNLGPLTVVEATAGMRVQPNHVYVAPGDFHMAVRRRGAGVEIALNQDAPEHSCRPAVDVLFRSVADVYGAGTLAVVLTGMGSDGLRGCESIHACGGRILTQDEASSVVWGMPGFVTRAGLACKTVPLDAIAAELALMVKPDVTVAKRPA